MCSLQPFSLDTKQEDEDLHVVVEKSGVTVTIDKEIEEISREEIIDETDSYQSNQSKLNERMHSHTIIDSVMTSSPRDGKALKGRQTWAQPLGWPLSHQVCWVVSEMVQGYHS